VALNISIPETFRNFQALKREQEDEKISKKEKDGQKKTEQRGESGGQKKKKATPGRKHGKSGEEKNKQNHQFVSRIFSGDGQTKKTGVEATKNSPGNPPGTEGGGEIQKSDFKKKPSGGTEIGRLLTKRGLSWWSPARQKKSRPRFQQGDE